MALYKLTKGTISVIRQNREGVKQAEADGYKLDGEVNEAYEVVNPYPRFDDPAPAKVEEPELRRRGRPSKFESDGE
jgi:hypothetical protein